MFGYVTINREQMTEQEFIRFRAFYCGLCRSLKKSSGNSGRITLSYDMAFLGLLLTSLYEPESVEGAERCLMHPAKPHDYVANSMIDYAADMNLALAYHKCRDDWADDKNAVKLAEKLLLEKSYSRIRSAYPRQIAALEAAMSDGLAAEQVQQPSVDDCLRAASGLLAELFAPYEDLWAEDLRQMGASLARFIYFMDAYEDLPKDKKKNRFNPLLPHASRPDYEDWCRRNLTMLIAECTDAFERLPLEQDLNLLRNVLYSGVWSRYAFLQKQAEKKKKD